MKKFRQGNTLWFAEVAIVPGGMNHRTRAKAKVYPVQVLHTYTRPDDEDKEVTILVARFKGRVERFFLTVPSSYPLYLTYRKAQRYVEAQAKIEDDGFARGWEDYQRGLEKKPAVTDAKPVTPKLPPIEQPRTLFQR